MTASSAPSREFTDVCVKRHEAEELIRLALREAEVGMANGEIPIGAVVAGKTLQAVNLISKDHNRNIQLDRHTAHAEMMAFERCLIHSPGMNRRGNPEPATESRLLLISTLEPCIMCFSAAILVGVTDVIFALRSPADGGLG
jgi:tRNA(adenine34) deaminase